MQTFSGAQELLKTRDFEKFFLLPNKKDWFNIYFDHYHLIPDKQKYDLFIQLYLELDYGFDAFASQMSKIMTQRDFSSAWRNRLMKFKEDLKHTDSVTIYRGEGKPSTAIDKSWSWTLSSDVAYDYATRLSNKGFIYQTRVGSREILDYLNHRDEKEVLVSPRSIQGYRKISVNKE